MSELGAEKRPVGRPRSKAPRPIWYLSPFSPLEKEQIARWLDAYLPALEFQIQHVQGMLNTGNDFPGAANQLLYNRVKYSVIQELAWFVRTSRGGPLGGGPKQRKRGGQSPPE